MLSLSLQSHVGSDGILKLQVPVGLSNTDLEIMLIFQPIKLPSLRKKPEDLGWPPNFFEQTFGSCAEDPLVRAPPGEYEEREVLLCQPEKACPSLLRRVTHLSSEVGYLSLAD